MTNSKLDAAALLAELRELSRDTWAARLQAEGPADELVVALGDEAERLALVEVSQAVEASEFVVQVADQIGAARGRARARRARAQALAYAGRLDEALASGREAAQVAQAGGEPIEAARAKLASLHPLGEMGRYDEALRIGAEAREALLNAGAPALAARADINLGVIHQNRDNPADALTHLDRARSALRDEPMLLGFVENNRGEALLALNRFEQAEQAFQASLASSERAKANLAAAIAEGNLADLAARRGLLQQALRYFEQARRRFERDAASGHLARLIVEQADALETLGLTEDALHSYQEALPKLREQGLAAEEARARAGLGRALLRMNRLLEAEQALDQAAAAYEELGNPTERGRVDLIRAELAIEHERPDQARELLKRSVEALAERPAEAAAAAYHTARLALHEGEYEIVERELSRTIPQIEQLDLAPLLADLLHVRGAARGSAGKLEPAVADLRAAVGQVERVRGTLQADRFRAAFLGNRLAIYEDLTRALLDGGGHRAVAEAFATVEQAKGRSLLDLARGALDVSEPTDGAAADEAEAPLIEQLSNTRAELNALYSQMVAGASWRNAILEKERELQQFENRLSSARGVASLYAPTIELEEAQALVPADAALLEYFIAGDELLVFVLRRDRATVVRRPAQAEELAQRVGRVRFQLSRAARPGACEGARGERLERDVRRELEALAAIVLEPLRATLADVSRLAIIPHGPLHLVPFHALWDGEQYLIQRCEICYAPSASMMAYMASRSSESPTGVGVKVLVAGISDETAPLIAREAQRVAEIFGGCELLIERDATAQRVTKAAAQADIIHLACHGRYSTHSPLTSGLKLADRWLTVRDIYGMRLRADLVTLSGCDTGRAQVAAGDELLGLMRGFFAAGASSMLVSLWQVHDEIAAETMSIFYRAWYNAGGNRSGKVGALRQAQLAGLAERPHPVFWAPFVLVGKP